MNYFYRLSVCTIISAVALLAAPQPNSVQNPGSNSLPGLPNYGIAQGSVFVVYGSAMGPSSLVVAPSLPLQTTLSATSVSVTVGGTTVNAPMSYTYATQIAAILPSNTPVGTGTLTVTYNGQSGSTPITVVSSNLGILSQNETGTGPAVATHADYSLITAGSAANNNETIILWGTGLGPLPNGVSDAAAPGALGNLSAPITVYIGGVQASVAYHGRNASDPGLDQINVVVPAGVSGCYVSVVAQMGSLVSNTTSIAVTASGNTCSDANGLSLSSLTTPFNTNGTASLGFVSILNSSYAVSFGPVSETINASIANATFEKFTPTQFYSSTFASLPSIGSCSILVINSAATGSPITATGLDAGPSIALSGPGVTATLAPLSASRKGYYSSQLTSVSPGTYQVTGPGGADVGAFTASIAFPPLLTWTNQTAITGNPIDRTQPLVLNWTGGDANSFTIIEGTSENPATFSSGSIGTTFICIAPTSAGTFTVPTSILQSLPATGTGGFTAGSIGLLLFGSTSKPVSFTAPGLDYGFALTEQIAGSSVSYK